MFHHDHGAIDNHAKIQRAKGKRVGGNVLSSRQMEANNREGNSECNNDCAAHVAKENKENNHHQDDSLGQIVVYGVGGEVEQFASVDEGTIFTPWGRICRSVCFTFLWMPSSTGCVSSPFCSTAIPATTRHYR